MSRRIGQPVNQVRLTNVAMVRIHKGGKRFEIACYRNKVLSWRQGVEKDIDEVLQTHAIFLNVSKGVLASSKDLMDCFGQEDVEALLRLILEKGEYHPSDKEREAMHESLYRDIATIVALKSVNPTSNRPYTVNMILSGMKDIHFAVNPTRGAKQQALEVIRRLQDVMPLERAKMRLKVVCPTTEDLAQVIKGMASFGIDGNAVEATGKKEEVDLLVDPGLFRRVDELVRGKGKGALHVLELNVQQEGEADVDLEIARKAAMRKEQRDESAVANTCKAFEEAQEREGRKETDQEGEAGFLRGANVKAHGDEDSVVEGAEEHVDKQGRVTRGSKKSKAARRREKEIFRERELRKEEECKRRERQGEERPKSEESNKKGGGSERGSWEKARPGSNRLACNTCRVDFQDAKKYREHYRTDWHRYNLKLKEKGGGPVSEAEFELVDADEMFCSYRDI